MNPDEGLQIRSAVAATALFDQRVIVMRCVPYNVRQRVGAYDETLAPGIFDDAIGKRGDRIRLHRSHDPESVIGRAFNWDNSEQELVGHFKVADTTSGTEALQLASEGLLSGSVAFKPLPAHSQWSPDRSHVYRTRAVLDHVAMTADPAYVGTDVLAVRSNDLANLSATREWLAAVRS